MRKIFNISVAALAMFGAIACSTAPVEEIIGNNTTVTASFVDSRTALSEGVKSVWSADDKIEVNGTTFTLSQGAGEATAVFVSEQRLADAESYVATYPAGVTAVPTTQSAVAGSFDPVAALASGTSVTLNNILFEHKHALLKFSLPQSASKVEVAGYTLAGNIEQGKTYYIAVAAGTYNIEVKVDDVVVKSSQNTLEAVNGHIYNLGLVEQPAIGIYTADDLVAFAAEIEAQIAAEQTPDGGKFKDANGVVNILANIDMKDVAWTPISNFVGTLEGNNHTIDNLVVATTESSAAMFKNLSDATIQNLVFGEGCSFSASGLDGNNNTYVAAVVARILTGATLENITSSATVSGGNFMGGFCAAADLKKGDILFKNLINNGAVLYPEAAANANIVIGGIVGQTETGVTMENCTNNGTVTNKSNSGNKYNKAGGIVGGAGDIVMSGCTNTGTVTVDVRDANHIWAGGLIGSSYRGFISNNSNTGEIIISDNITGNASMYVGGCFGALEGNSAPGDGSFYKYTNCTNSASITINKAVAKDTLLGGVVGYLYLVDVQVEECSNSGAITLTKQGASSAAGGIVGLIAKTSSSKPVNGSQINNCTNTGAVSMNSPANKNWVHVGGVVGGTTHDKTSINGCINRGDVTVASLSRSNPGGIISQCQCNVTNCINYGTIYSTDAHTDYFSGTGGIVSRLNAAVTVSGCTNYGTVIYNGKGFGGANTNKGIVGQGGIAGLMNYGTITDCANYGVVLGNDYDASLGAAEYVNAKGSIVGWGGCNAAVTIKNCKVGGALGSCVDTDTDMGVAKAVAITAETYADYIFGGDAKNGVTVTDCSFAVSE